MLELSLELHGADPDAKVAVLTLVQPGRPVVVLDEELMRSMERALASVPDGVRGLVVASGSERSFVAGADLKAIVEKNDDDLRSYLELGARVFSKLSTAPFPTAAAIQGAALGGGLELAMHCDALIAAPSPSGKPYPIGLPECGLAICPGWGGTNLLPARMEPGRAIEMTAAGRTFDFESACGAGLFDLVVGVGEDLIASACAWVRAAPVPERDGAPSRWIGRTDCRGKVASALAGVRDAVSHTQAGAAVSDAVAAGLEKGWDAAISAEREHLIRLRHTPQAQEAIQAFFARSKK
ncbi:MAG: hypothetical protein Kow0022_02060 [Phycisphaerales bacterium]